MPTRRPLLLALLLSSLAAPAAACLWDYDTLQMERERFPGALELIVGKFLRHTDEFYEWRVKDRRAKIAAHDAGEKKLTDEDLARAYDDLAAALDKLKRHDEAIATIRKKAERLPKTGEYETHANLGTFLAHSGRLEEGVAELKRAIEINPEAHFGREKYQVLLIEYVIEKRGQNEANSLPLLPDQRLNFVNDTAACGFAEWVLARNGLDQPPYEDPETKKSKPTETDAELDRAIKGVLGMMRFGDYRSPVLLEALGDLLLARSSQKDAKLLAARAYLKASQEAAAPQAAAAYRRLTEETLNGHQGAMPWSETVTLASLESQLRREIHEADAWFAKTIAHDEELWVKASVDPTPDERFWEKYGGQDIRVGHDRLPPAQFASSGLSWTLRAALAGVLLTTIAALAAALYWRRRRPTGYDYG